MVEELEVGTEVVVDSEVVETEQSGQKLEVTAEPGTEENGEVTEPGEVEEAPEEKVLTQKQFDEELGKRLAREKRKFERQQQEAREVPPLELESKLDPAAFATTEEYIDALADERADAKIAHREKSQSVNAIEIKYQDQVDDALDRYPDYVQVAHQHSFMTAEMAAAIKSSDIAVDMAYHLGTNLDEAERIFKLSPMLQVKELGKLEAKLEAETPAATKTTKAPAPLKPIATSKTNVAEMSTTDPKLVGKISNEEWIRRDRLRRSKPAK